MKWMLWTYSRSVQLSVDFIHVAFLGDSAGTDLQPIRGECCGHAIRHFSLQLTFTHVVFLWDIAGTDWRCMCAAWWLSGALHGEWRIKPRLSWRASMRSCLCSGCSTSMRGSWRFVCLLVGCLLCLLPQQHGSVSAQSVVRAATVRFKLQIKLSILPSHSILTRGQPVPALTL